MDEFPMKKERDIWFVDLPAHNGAVCLRSTKIYDSLSLPMKIHLAATCSGYTNDLFFWMSCIRFFLFSIFAHEILPSC